jgi:ATP-dependent exoDNAse (exonuclease V) alpha subunit
MNVFDVYGLTVPAIPGLKAAAAAAGRIASPVSRLSGGAPDVIAKAAARWLATYPVREDQRVVA